VATIGFVFTGIAAGSHAAHIEPNRRGGSDMLTPSIRFLLIAGATVVYLGLAVQAYGGAGAFFSHAALMTLALVLVALSLAAVFAGGNLSSGEREDRGNRWVIAAIGIIGLLDVYLPPFADARGIWTVDGETIRWAGVVLFAAGGGLRLWPVVVLGDRFSGLVAIQKGHRLVTGGIYRIIRHPSYLGLLVNSLGWGLAFRSLIGVLLTALLVVPVIGRIRAEENLLASQFGAEYDAYRARTSQLIPGVY
jgi:protein-S-isoprenylcysteine O-methyltransferase Ste14